MINISVDGGGSKLSVLAFDENLNVLATEIGGGINSLFLDEKIVRENIGDTISSLLSKLKKDYGTVKTVDNLYITMAGPAEIFINELSAKVELKKYLHLGEGELGIYAGTLGGDGLLALSGTGSDCFYNENGRTVNQIGGWGMYFGDEGSGFYIGRKAIIAAIKSHDGRGEKSLLERLVFEKLGLKRSMWEVCSLHVSRHFRTDVAKLTYAVSEAYKSGDFVAKQIIEDSAEELAIAATTLLRQCGKTEDSKFLYTTAGGSWKIDDYMTDYFSKLVNEKYPQAVFMKPSFEPVVGGAVCFVIENGEKPDKFVFAEKFKDFLIK